MKIKLIISLIVAVVAMALSPVTWARGGGGGGHGGGGGSHFGGGARFSGSRGGFRSNGARFARPGFSGPRVMNSNRFVGRQSANWHRNWDRGHDHRFGGHRFRFINGFWWDLDLWPYDYYAYDYPYDYYDYPSDNYSDANYSDATVSAVQSQLTRLGYYRGAIDGVYGPQTRGALARYQGKQGLPTTGTITTATLRSLRVPAGAS